MKQMKNDTSSNTTVLSFNSHSYIGGSAIEESSSTLLQKLHTNERQLRALAVVLSLTGGLALSFALGVGIMIYWYCHKYKHKGVFDNEDGRAFDDNESEDSDDEKSSNATDSSCCSCNIRNCNYYINDSNTITSGAIEQQIVNIINESSSSSGHHETNSGGGSMIYDPETLDFAPTTNNTAAVTSSQSSIDDILLLPLPPLSHIPTPEPSAPSAKELHFQAEHSTHDSNTSPSNANAIELEEALCHDCSIPPPAYTRD